MLVFKPGRRRIPDEQQPIRAEDIHPRPNNLRAAGEKWFFASEVMSRSLEIKVTACDADMRSGYGSIDDRLNRGRYLFFLLDDRGRWTPAWDAEGWGLKGPWPM